MSTGLPLPGNSIIFPGYIIPTDDTPVDITLKVTSSLGCSEAAAIPHTFKTQKGIIASFRTDITEGCGPLTVQFTNQSSQLTGVTFSWDFSNGQTSPKVTPEPVTFLPDPSGNDKVYDITLIARTNCGVSIRILLRCW